MKTRKCYVYIFDGFADWEPALVSVALQQFTDFEVLTFSKDDNHVRSMGNLNVKPDTSLEKVSFTQIDLLILPGGVSWTEGANHEIIPLLNAMLNSGKPVAAICGATAFLAEHGYLDEIKHTSNHPDYYLKAVAPNYKGRDNYVMKPSVSDGNLITAGGVTPVEFTEEILNYFGLLESNEKLAEWFHYFKHPELALT